jgi:hypothetical protein
MPAIGTGSDIDYLQVAARISAPGRVVRGFRVTFPNNATNNTYPAGGVPLDKAKMGSPRGVAALDVIGRTPQAGATNVFWQWNGDPQAPKLVGYEIDGSAATDTQQVELDAGDVLATNGAVLVLYLEGA